MTQDEIIEMARKAGIKRRTDVFYSEYCDGIYGGDLETFAKLVAAKEREAWERRYTRLQSLMDLRETQPNKPCCLAEREACADLCWKNEDDNAFVNSYNGKRIDLLCSELIRARGQA